MQRVADPPDPFESPKPLKRPKQQTLGSFFKPLASSAEKAKQDASQQQQLDEKMLKARADAKAREQALLEAKRPIGRPRNTLVAVRRNHQPGSNQQVSPTNKLGSKRHNWFAHPQIARMILRQVEISKGYRPVIRESQKNHFVSGLFARLREVTVRGWFEEGSYTKLTAGAVEAMQRGSSFYKLVGSGRRALLSGDLAPAKEEIVKLLCGLRAAGVAFM